MTAALYTCFANTALSRHASRVTLTGDLPFSAVASVAASIHRDGSGVGRPRAWYSRGQWEG